MRWPLDKYFISQGYSQTHTGIDLAAPTGTPVLSPVAGVVIAVGNDANYIGGRYVVVRERDDDRWEYYTGHHSELCVRHGQEVREGQLIARVGATGQASGPHVHFQVRKFNAGSLMNPQDVFIARHVQGASTTMAAPNPNVDEGGLNTLYEAYFGRQPDTSAKNWIGKPWQLVVYELATSKEMQQKRQRDAEVYAFYEANKNKQFASPAAIQLEQLIKQIGKS